MKKTIFKGIINGKEFDNLKDYNDEIRRLIDNNETINAETSTKIIEDINEFDYEKSFPTLNSEGQYYLDRLVTGDMEKNDDLFNKEMDKLAQYYDKIRRDDKFYSNMKLKKAIKDNIEMVQNDNIKTIDKLKELENKIDILEQSERIIDLYVGFYEDLLALYKECKCEECKCEECKCEECKCEECKCEEAQSLEEEISNLVKRIFGNKYY